VPKRGEQHRVDDQARTAVEKVLASGGLATEVVHKDYGEDLLVQISIDDHVQPARLWVQVKGTRDSSRISRRDGTYSVRVGTGHLLRWARSADPVLLVLWDVSRDCGWWARPKAQVDQFALYMGGHKTQAVRVSSEHELNTRAVRKLAWQFTLEHFTNLIVQADVSGQVAREMAEITGDESHDGGAEARGSSVLAFDVLRLLGVLGEGGVAEDALQKIRNAMGNLAQEGLSDGDALLEQAAILCILGIADERAGLGLPHLLLRSLTIALVRILRATHFQPTGK
jgi:hypothetical protein